MSEATAAETVSAPTEQAVAEVAVEAPAQAQAEASTAVESETAQDSAKDGTTVRKTSNDKGGNEKKFRKNVKTDFDSLPESSDPDEIRQQVEFYFNDSNLVQDKFLFTQVEGTKNNWVDIKTIHNFKRMRHFQPFSAVVKALKESETLEVNDKDQIRRKNPLPEDVGTEFDDARQKAIQLFEDRSQPRSIYAKGFGEEGPRTQFDIEAFFAPYGPVNAVRLRRTAFKAFKGSVFVEFDSEETQQAFLALDPKPKFNGSDLLILSKKAYVEQKLEDIKSGKIRANDEPHRRDHGGRGRGGFRGRGGARGRGGRGGRGRGGKFDRRDRRENGKDGEDDRDWKTRRDDFQKGKENGSEDKKVEPVKKDASGIPIVEAVSDEQARKDPLAEKPIKFNEAEEQERKKRTRGDDDGATENDAKKAKTEIEA